MKLIQLFFISLVLITAANVINASTVMNIKVDNIETSAQSETIKDFKLHQNYPNPFNPSTNISYTIPQKAEVTLKVFDILGNEIAILVNQVQSKGTYQVEFNADKIGNGLTSGIYLYQLKALGSIQTKKFTLSK